MLVQVGLYAYYLATAAGLRAMSPALALMTAQETHLSGSFRAAHQVLPSSGLDGSFPLSRATLFAEYYDRSNENLAQR